MLAQKCLRGEGASERRTLIRVDSQVSQHDDTFAYMKFAGKSRTQRNVLFTEDLIECAQAVNR